MRATTMWLGLALIWPGMPVLAQSRDADVILTPTELAALERENAMWRASRVDESAEQNLKRWRTAGFTTAEVDALTPRLHEIWDVEPPRQYGWLPDETIERIKEVDQEFIVRWRAVRRHQATGIRFANQTPEDLATLNRAWQRAVMRVLEPRDVAEYRLMNSWSAQTVTKLAKDVPLKTVERRILCQWQKEFDGVYGAENKFADRFRRAEFKAAQLDHWRQFRALLGDQRFALYLANAEPDFLQLAQTLDQINHAGATAVLDLWFIRQHYEVARVRSARRQEGDRLRADAVEQVTTLLGRNDFSAYRETENAEWLN